MGTRLDVYEDAYEFVSLLGAGGMGETDAWSPDGRYILYHVSNQLIAREMSAAWPALIK